MQQPDLLQDRFDSSGVAENAQQRFPTCFAQQQQHNNTPFKNVFTDCTRVLNTLSLVSLYCGGARKLSLSNKYKYVRPFFAILPN